MRDKRNDLKLYTREELRNLSRFRLQLYKIKLRLLICYYTGKAWVFLQLIRFRGLFDPEMKKQYIVYEYRYRKSKEL